MSIHDAALVLVLGLGAGILTTTAGLGGGVLLVLSLSLAWDPRIALAVTAPALLVGNAHRLFLDRKSVDRRLALRFVAGALPATFVVGLLAVAIPAAALRVVLVVTTALAVAREFGWLEITVRDRTIPLAGVVCGGLSGTGGAAGLLVAPVLLSAGKKGPSFIATSAAIAVAMHAGRIAAYGISGFIDARTLVTSGALALAILAGNTAGKRIRDRLEEKTMSRLTYATLVVAVGLAVIGVAA